jgi:hypothetical protein
MRAKKVTRTSMFFVASAIAASALFLSPSHAKQSGGWHICQGEERTRIGSEIRAACTKMRYLNDDGTMSDSLMYCDENGRHVCCNENIDTGRVEWCSMPHTAVPRQNVTPGQAATGGIKGNSNAPTTAPARPGAAVLANPNASAQKVLLPPPGPVRSDSWIYSFIAERQAKAEALRKARASSPAVPVGGAAKP